MTSRRTFLGLMATAPLIAPSVVKAAAKPRWSSGGIIGKAFGSQLVGEDCHGGFALSPSQSKAFLEAMEQPVVKLESLTILMRSPTPWGTPNRLHGAYVNEEGDAV